MDFPIDRPLYNEFYGLKQPPNLVPAPSAEEDPFANLRAANVRRNRARHTHNN